MDEEQTGKDASDHTTTGRRFVSHDLRAFPEVATFSATSETI
jgi:hypothetical protein